MTNLQNKQESVRTVLGSSLFAFFQIGPQWKILPSKRHMLWLCYEIYLKKTDFHRENFLFIRLNIVIKNVFKYLVQ